MENKLPKEEIEFFTEIGKREGNKYTLEGIDVKECLS
jgi:hypothetical protein